MQLPRTPVVALTAHAVNGVREKCLASGMNDFLAKPFSFEEITSKVSQWTGAGSEAVAGGYEHYPVRAANANGHGENRQPGSGEHAPASSPAFDPAALERLDARKQYRKRDLVKRVVSLYLEQTPTQLEELAQAIRQADAEAQTGIAHTVKSSSLTVGATALADTCRKIEELGKHSPVDTGLIDEFMQQYSAAEKALRQVLASRE